VPVKLNKIEEQEDFLDNYEESLNELIDDILIDDNETKIIKDNQN